MLRTFFAHEPGQGLTEYALIILLIAIVVITAVEVFGLKVLGLYDFINGSWPP